MIKNKLKELLIQLKKFKVQTILVLDYKKRNDRKIFHSNARLIASNSDIAEGFKSRQQSIMTKIKNSASKNRTVIETILKHNIKIFGCAQVNGDNKQLIRIIYRLSVYFQRL